MQTDSSASRTWRLSRSASLNTATVAVFSSRQARMIRSASAPRLATRTLRNIPLPSFLERELVLRVVALRQRTRLRARCGAERAAAVGGRIDRLPLAVRGRRDTLELKTQLG